ncbi:MAG: CHAD domain-containing protein [Saprospiraceae bacterium]
MSSEMQALLEAQYAKLELEWLECVNLNQQKLKKPVVHQMRVNLKKQLAFLILMQHVVEQERLAEYAKVIRALQKQLGKLRNCQVQRTKAELIESDLGHEYNISNFLKEKEADYQEGWSKFIEDTNPVEAMAGIRVLVSAALEKISPDLLEGTILGGFRHILFEIKSLSNIAGFNTDVFHELRVFLKQLIYCWDFLQPHFADLPIEPAFWQVVKQLEQALGEWHDYKSLLKKVETDKDEAFAFVVKDYLEDYKERARALLPLLDEMIPTIEPLFLSKHAAEVS